MLAKLGDRDFADARTGPLFGLCTRVQLLSSRWPSRLPEVVFVLLANRCWTCPSLKPTIAPNQGHRTSRTR